LLYYYGAYTLGKPEVRKRYVSIHVELEVQESSISQYAWIGVLLFDLTLTNMYDYVMLCSTFCLPVMMDCY
jgi:hypothetical protein